MKLVETEAITPQIILTESGLDMFHFLTGSTQQDAFHVEQFCTPGITQWFMRGSCLDRVCRRQYPRPLSSSERTKAQSVIT